MYMLGEASKDDYMKGLRNINKHTWKRLRVRRGMKPLHLMISANTIDGGGGMGSVLGNFLIR
jgi:hypothetical protein